MQLIKKILLSRTDGIGDMLLTLQMLDVIKQQNPQAEVYILGQNYTKPIADATQLLAGFIDWSELKRQDNTSIVQTICQYNFDAIVHVFPNKHIANIARSAKIPVRIGTSHRIFHWLTCNKLINLARKNSNLHESQLNIMLLKKLGIPTNYTLEKIKHFGKIKPFAVLPTEIENLLNNNSKRKIVLHPKSKGSARNWPLTNFSKLSAMLTANNYETYVTGTKEEGDIIRQELGDNLQDAIDLTGKLSLAELITFISRCDCLVAVSTGPLHIAAALDIATVGLYPPLRPMHPERWQQIGENATVMCANKKCNKCQNSLECKCMQAILPEEVLKTIIDCFMGGHSAQLL